MSRLKSLDLEKNTSTRFGLIVSWEKNIYLAGGTAVEGWQEVHKETRMGIARSVNGIFF